MELIERYLQAIGRALPEKQRADILSELRSSLYDAVEERDDGISEEAAAETIIREMGPPQKVAASYYPAGQYLIGPSLYPLFQTVLGIVFTVVIVIQLIGVGLAITVSGGTSILDEVASVGSSLTGALGSVVVIFWFLQRLEVRPDSQAAFNPRDLPALERGFEPISRGERIFNILVNVAALVFLTRFAVQGGFTSVNGATFFENPVIAQYFPWLVVAVMIGIVLDIVLLWRGRWEVTTRIVAILSSVYSLGLLYVMLQAHNAILTAAGIPGLFNDMGAMPELIAAGSQYIGMIIFRMGIAGAFIVILVEAVFHLYRLIRPRVVAGSVPPIGSMSMQR